MSFSLPEPKTIIEPFKIKMVEPIPYTTESERRQQLKEKFYNLFFLESKHITFDFLTDSGTSAMSQNQWSALMKGDESYAGAKSFENFQKVVQDLTGFEYIIPTHQGRSAEYLLMRALNDKVLLKGKKILGNTHFDTTRANIESVGAEAVDLPVESREEDFFLGNIDLEKLKKALKEGFVASVIITVTNNSLGGLPVSMENIKGARKPLQSI